MHGYLVRTFSYDGAGRMVWDTVFTLTTEFAYRGLGAGGGLRGRTDDALCAGLCGREPYLGRNRTDRHGAVPLPGV